ncbi:molybdopterin-dependent oxidoreductase [Streptomyces sp. SID13031]|uniref:molybdopterin-dependent oxidoreductase n=1 Tax=Streptomyces sp. SID13031 TaxID=2706046 RepID=UPI0013CA3042|nr:molybdopterin-dependent oxidoreductase [Streptomyces sp. SID13031]NEA31860.1 molybdopterin-dependent oxidoreductase [Streptomyces sp. SID13031]
MKLPQLPKLPLPQPPTEESFPSPLHHPRTATVLGRWLGVAITICFLTGLFSHFQQATPGWLAIPTRPASLYRVTQGLHVLSGIVSVPLLLAKLWTVYPKLFAKLPWPPSRKALGTVLERGSILVLVSALALELFIGFLNTLQWYPWPFPFKETHYALAWIIIGALLVHLAVKLPLIIANWRRTPADRTPVPQFAELPNPQPDAGTPVPRPADSLPPAITGLSRRGLFRTVAGAASLVGIASVGQSVPALGPIAVLSPRKPDIGPQGLPVNRTAEAAGVVAVDTTWRFTVAGPAQLSYSLDQLRALPQSRSALPIACVEGWSQGARWEGIRIRDLLKLCEAPEGSHLRVVSMEKGGFYATSELPPQFAEDPLTLLALRLNGTDLDLDHGFPARIIAPNRPGIFQTKWVHRLEVLK